MKITWKTFLAVSAYWAGVFGWFLAGALIQGFLYLSLAGGVWCVGYMISEYFKESK